MGNAVSSTAAPVMASVFTAIDNFKRVENPYMKLIREKGVVSVDVEKGDDYIIRRSKSAERKSRREIHAEFTAEQSMPLMLKASCAKFPQTVAVGFRNIVKTAKEKILDEKGNEKEWEFLYLGETQYLSYAQIWSKIVAFANGLRVQLGIKPGQKVALYEETRWEWLVSCYGAWLAGATVVTVYANLGEDALVYALKESECNAVVCASKQVKKLVTLCSENGIQLAAVIATDHQGNAPTPAGQKPQVCTWESVVDAGAGLPEPSTIPTSPEALALIMYTSGTTGDPKGVMLSQGNVLASVKALDMRLKVFLHLAEGEPTYCAYLPLAHILEFAAENVMLMNGFRLGYGNPRTLTNTSARPHGDLQEFKPLLFAGVPRIYDTIKKGIEAKLPPVGTLKRTLFDRAFAERRDALKRGLDTPFFNKRVFSAAASALGGNVQFMVSGGAPLSATTQEWLTVVFGCAVGQGYGLTETASATSIQDYYNPALENVGKLLSCCEVKLRSVNEFKVTDSPPRGEILVRGPTVAKGYYKQEDKTKEAFLEDGFFATGDVGQFQPDGTLKIVGRTKALAKNAHGEYIAMEALESMYVQNNLVMPNGICIDVDSHQPFIVAVALTDQHKAMDFAKARGIAGTFPAILKDKKFLKAAVESLAQTGKDNGKKPFELIKNVRFYAEEWTPENGILTAAMKLKRREITAKYGQDIQEMYAESQ